MAEEVLRIARGVAGALGLRSWVLWVAAVFLAAMAPTVVAAQDGPHSTIRIAFTADRPTLTVGDIVTLTLEVTHPADHVAVVPRIGPEWGPFEVISQTMAQTDSNADGTETTSQRMEVTIFAPGTFDTPDLSLTVRGPDGGVERLFLPPLQLNVTSVLSGSDETLRDIRPPADLPPSLWRQPATLAIAALAVLAVLLPGSYFVHRRLRGQDEQPALAAETRTPWEIAVQEVGRIEKLDLPGQGRFKEHYTLVAEVTKAYVRSMYLEGSSLTDAAEMTTDETVSAIWRSSLDHRNARLVVDLLNEADLVRFSNYSPLETEANEALRQARAFLEDTRPVAAEEPQQDVPGQPEATA